MLMNYLHINEKSLNMFVEQIPAKYYPKKYKRKKSISLAISGPKVEMSEEPVDTKLTNNEKIQLLIQFLKKNEMLDYERPKEMYDFANQRKGFVLESMTATKVIFPKESLTSLQGIDEFALWISDPNPDDISNDPLVYNGTFLYITQMWLDDGWYTPIHSGCSALQAIVNYLEGRPILNTILPEGCERYGRSTYEHPINKLTRIGAIKSSTKKITSLYQKRYITNEQCYIFANNETRVNDLLGYPIYISEEM
ncbi:hypothetical protein ACHOLT_19250 [Desulfitobacterium sp. Sab5]|uniref:hypothetical protein n=1 Tax=Desulfitobacterium nosdiversum TaxID=3375356 RepID=UPI003CF80458